MFQLPSLSAIIFWMTMTFTTLILQNLEGIENYYPFFIKCSWQSFPKRQCVYRHFFSGVLENTIRNFSELSCNTFLSASRFGRYCNSIPQNFGWYFPILPQKKGRYSHIVIQKMIADSEGSWNITAQILLIKWNFSIKFVR